jgi:hypothetical protein
MSVEGRLMLQILESAPPPVQAVLLGWLVHGDPAHTSPPITVDWAWLR